MSKLETTISGKRLDPFFGNAAADYTRIINGRDEVEDYRLFSELNKQGLLGFITTKTLTTEPREGNPHPRFAWTENAESWDKLYNEVRIKAVQGLQSMGLPNIGVYNYPFAKCDAPTIVSYVGKSVEETKTMTQYVSEQSNKNQNIFAVEYNVACPNVAGCPSCYKEDSLEHLKTVRENTRLPVFAKIGYFPEEERLIEFGKKLEDMGINGVTAINSPPGMGIDAYSRKTLTQKKYAGVFGRGVKPLALRTVNILHENTGLDIIGLGGIYSFEGMIEYLLAGATAVEICSKFTSEANASDLDLQYAVYRIVDKCWAPFLREFKNDTENYMEKNGMESLEEIVGKLKA